MVTVPLRIVDSVDEFRRQLARVPSVSPAAATRQAADFRRRLRQVEAEVRSEVELEEGAAAHVRLQAFLAQRLLRLPGVTCRRLALFRR